MSHSILRSVINLTEQRDVASLEYSLLATIPELLPIHTISLYKPVLEDDFQEVEEILRFHAKSPESKTEGVWYEKSVVLEAEQLLIDCFQSANVMEMSRADGISENYLPITTHGKVLAVLHVTSESLDSAQCFVLSGLTRIYENYLAILNESERDQLTSLLNRRTFDQSFDKLVAAQQKRHQEASKKFSAGEKRKVLASDRIHLAIFDIDFFKRVNDDYGHTYGDEILLLMAKLMRESFRSSDLLFRFGGEEFVVLLEPTSNEMAFKVLERFRHKVEAYTFPQVGNVTISIGYTEVTDASFSTDVVGRADRVLYFSKENGRNCTHNFEKLVEQGCLDNAAKSTGSVELF